MSEYRTIRPFRIPAWVYFQLGRNINKIQPIKIKVFPSEKIDAASILVY
jgi:hypothetical protein